MGSIGESGPIIIQTSIGKHSFVLGAERCRRSEGYLRVGRTLDSGMIIILSNRDAGLSIHFDSKLPPSLPSNICHSIIPHAEPTHQHRHQDNENPVRYIYLLFQPSFLSLSLLSLLPISLPLYLSPLYLSFLSSLLLCPSPKKKRGESVNRLYR